MSITTIEQYAGVVGEKVRPLGASVTVDYKTDNLIVVWGGFGFAITRIYMEEHTPGEVAAVAVEITKEMVAGKRDRPVQSESKLLEQRNQPTAFDA